MKEKKRVAKMEASGTALKWRFGLTLLSVLVLLSGGCATIRVTDPPRSATEQFLISVAATRAIEQLSTTSLRDRKVYVDPTYFYAGVPSEDQTFVMGEIRAKLLSAGVRLASYREEAQVILEVRSPGLSVDRTEYLLGIPAFYLNSRPNSAAGSVPVATPELSIIKNTRQRGYAGLAFVAYWADTGELIASSGPFIGRTVREDFWFFGVGPSTSGNIPPAQK